MGVLASVGDEPADVAGEMRLSFWMAVSMVGWAKALETLEVADLIFAGAIP